MRVDVKSHPGVREVMEVHEHASVAPPQSPGVVASTKGPIKTWAVTPEPMPLRLEIASRFIAARIAAFGNTGKRIDQNEVVIALTVADSLIEMEKESRE